MWCFMQCSGWIWYISSDKFGAFGIEKMMPIRELVSKIYGMISGLDVVFILSVFSVNEGDSEFEIQGSCY